VIVTKASESLTDCEMNINRDATQTGGYTGTYTFTEAMTPAAVKTMTATFYSQTGVKGAVVGTASADITRGTDGSTFTLSNIVFNATVKQVTVIDPGLLAAGGGSTQLQFTASDATSNVVAVSTGSAIWAIASGTVATITPAGVISPTGAGTVQVTATVDGITSAPLAVTFN
ncbi:MAG: hypothetical protein ABUL72_00550, partial [Armatimonadota bacterium]